MSIECNDDMCTWNPCDSTTISNEDTLPYDNEVSPLADRMENMLFSRDTLTLKVKKLRDDVPPLKKAYDRPACVDISITHLIKIDNGIAYFGTGYAFESPEGYYIDLVSRSSGPKNGWTVANCVGKIDEDYRGEIIFALQPTSALAACTALELSHLQYKSEDEPYCSSRYEVCSPNDVVEYLVNKMKLPMSLGQFSLVKKEQFDIEVVEELSTTERGSGAFGSSNMK
jgi:dUTPase